MARQSGDVRDFEIWLKRMGKKRIPGWGEKVTQKLFIQVGDAMILGTPVGDASYWKNPPPKGYTGGRARGGWQASKNRAKVRDVNRVDKTGSAPRAEGRSTVPGFKLGESLFWSNSTPYILRLAHGWSRQAPNGWVPRNLRQIANQFNR